ncbi:LysR substrate-binding domain-containing protein [Verminephrobacter eiseniae]|uniref:LysR substrate-binding domain-containing protein n=1 Tax=Verminephrobacter eiseniae TaxID=364317 RepID=UPI002238C78B|nr:LysR substrate-binding domain-containing protein [Verminephrobacter eiseniae]
MPDDVVARELCELRWHFYCGPRFLETFGPCETPADLERTPFLSPHEGRKVPLELFCGTATASAVLTPRVSSENIRFLLDCALEDMGVTLLPSYFTQDMVEAGRLVQLLPQWYSNKNGSKLLIVTLPNRYPIPAAQALIDLLRAEVPGLLARA